MYNLRHLTYISQAFFSIKSDFFGMAYPVRDINPSKGCIIQPFCRLYYTTKSSGHKKGASKGVKRPLYECSKKGRKCYILSNWSGI